MSKSSTNQAQSEVKDPAPVRKEPPADLPPQHLTERLLEAYFKRFHCLVPILDKAEFLSSVREGTVSITLLRSVLFVASIHCEPEVYHLMGYSTRLDAGDELFSKACSAFDNDRGSDRTTMILASFLNQYFFGRPTEYRDALWWISNAIRSAQCMGYHRSTADSKMSARHKAQWKRVWWCLYMRDRQIALAMGVPMVINDLDFDVEELTLDDFPDEPRDAALYIITQASLSRQVSSLFFAYCCPKRLPLSHDPVFRHSARQDIQTKFEEWHANAPVINPSGGPHHLNLTLQVCYHFYRQTLQQRLQRLCPKPFADSEGSKLILDAANKVSSHVEDSLLYFTPQHFPMMYITAIFTAMTAHVAECGISGLVRDQLSQKLRPNLLALKQFETTFILARWIRNLFMDIINRPTRQAVHRTRHQQEHPPNTNRSSFEQPNPVTTSPHSQIQHQLPNQNPHAVTSAGHSFATTDQVAPTSIDDATYFYDSSSYDPGTSPSTIMGNFVPNFITNEYLHPQQGSGDMSGMNMIDFPSPSTLEYQSLHFLADLGLSGFNNYQ
ncbi:hypothetical protein, variant [Exophiala mesophila]|nr:hypothetical protein, variant [Exophiala mesophila]KIV93367.1 hypothetical protein, variant [Exophiala mesophila]